MAVEKNTKNAVVDKMAQRIITGFHAIEEKIKKTTSNENCEKSVTMTIFYSKSGPRVKKILALAKENNIPFFVAQEKTLDDKTKNLPEELQKHRGIVLCVEGENAKNQNVINFDEWILQAEKRDERKTVLLLDSITDPHNVGAIIRSADQFGVSLVIMPQHRGLTDLGSEVISRTSAGSCEWLPYSIVTNLIASVQSLKKAGFWIYGADAKGESIEKIKFPRKTAIIMGSEGTGISRLLKEQCDTIASIPTCGKIDSLNVSVAAGVLLYEVYRQQIEP